MIFYASLCKTMEKGRVIGIDIEIRDSTRKALKSHPLAPLISLVEGNSTAESVVNRVKSLITKGETVMVILDSNHTKKHVLAELEAYQDLISPGSYIIAADGNMKDLYDVPRGKPQWREDHPAAATREFAEKHPEFELQTPAWEFKISSLRENVSYWPSGWLRRRGLLSRGKVMVKEWFGRQKLPEEKKMTEWKESRNDKPSPRGEWKEFVKQFIPPILLPVYRKVRRLLGRSSH